MIPLLWWHIPSWSHCYDAIFHHDPVAMMPYSIMILLLWCYSPSWSCCYDTVLSHLKLQAMDPAAVNTAETVSQNESFSPEVVSIRHLSQWSKSSNEPKVTSFGSHSHLRAKSKTQNKHTRGRKIISSIAPSEAQSVTSKIIWHPTE